MALNNKKYQKLNFLSDSNIAKYTPILSNKKLIQTLLDQKVKKQNVETADQKILSDIEGYPDSRIIDAISDTLQSLTTEALTTQEMLQLLHEKYNKTEIEAISKFIKIVHAKDYLITSNPKRKPNNSSSKEQYFKADKQIHFKDSSFAIKIEKPDKVKNENRFKHKSTYGLYNASKISEEEVGLEQGDPYTVNPIIHAKLSESEKDVLVNQVDESLNLLQNKVDPSMSFVMIDSADIRIGTRNSIELATFFNTLSTIELSKCQPYFNVTFVLPSLVETKSSNVFKTASITQFLDGTPISTKANTTKNYSRLDATFERELKSRKGKVTQHAVNTNMSAFTMPQTINNFNDKFIGHNENIKQKTSDKFTRSTSVHDITRPFLTVKNFSIDVSPTQGLMSFKTGKLSLILHDRTRMVDIAPFIKPDLFGSFGAEIAVEYGWSHMDGKNGQENNHIANFLENNRVTEKYIITNASYTMENNGQVNIDLSIAMRAPIDIRGVTISTDPEEEIKDQNLKSKHKLLNAQIRFLKEKSNLDINIDAITSAINSTINEYLSDNNKSLKTISTLVKNRDRIKSGNSLVDLFKNINLLCSSKSDINNLNLIITSPVSITASGTNINLTSNVDEINKIFNYTSSIAISGSAYKNNKEAINAFVTRFKQYLRALTSYTDKQSQISKKNKALLEKIVGGLGIVDPFYNQEWLKNYYTIILKENDVETNGVSIKGIGDDLVQGAASSFSSNYVSFGSFLLGLIGTHMSTTGRFDEIQIVSYTANENCGLMSNLNIASFLIKRSELTNFLKQIFKGGITLTLESIISQVLNRFIITRLQVCYGLDSFYKRDSAGNTVVIEKDANTHKNFINSRLKDIYVGLATEKSKISESDLNDVRFVMPKVKLTFDTLTTKSSNFDKTICRISVFDQNDNPFASMSTIMKDVYDTGLITVSAQLNKTRANYRSKAGEFKGKSLKEAKARFYEKSWNLIQSLIDDGKLVEVSDGVYQVKSTFKLESLKNSFKRIMPSITYGTQNSAVIDANVTTVNESKLNTVYLTRSDRNGDNSKDTIAAKVKFQKDLPLRILPSQASITMFGCPFINFAQFLFLDFETGTTIDNQYAVTGIKHDISPGKFTTNLTLSYGDVYGKYENAVDTLTRVLTERKESQGENTQPKTDVNSIISIFDYTNSKIIKDTADSIQPPVNSQLVPLKFKDNKIYEIPNKELKLRIELYYHKVTSLEYKKDGDVIVLQNILNYDECENKTVEVKIDVLKNKKPFDNILKENRSQINTKIKKSTSEENNTIFTDINKIISNRNNEINKKLANKFELSKNNIRKIKKISILDSDRFLVSTILENIFTSKAFSWILSYKLEQINGNDKLSRKIKNLELNFEESPFKSRKADYHNEFVLDKNIKIINKLIPVFGQSAAGKRLRNKKKYILKDLGFNSEGFFVKYIENTISVEEKKTKKKKIYKVYTLKQEEKNEVLIGYSIIEIITSQFLDKHFGLEKTQ